MELIRLIKKDLTQLDYALVRNLSGFEPVVHFPANILQTSPTLRVFVSVVAIGQSWCLFG